MAEKLKMRTENIADKNFEALSKLFPNAVTEAMDENGEVVRAIDADVLRQEISCKVVEGREERYQFTWPDKKSTIALANQPINKTLRLVRDKSVGYDGIEGGIDSENIYIEGDNLEALKILRETYLGKVKTIYIDPPYNTGGDFVYRDNFTQEKNEYLNTSGQFDDYGNKMVPNAESNGRYHTNWLNMLYPRLRIARDLLTDDGFIFISIDEHEIENIKKICDEIYGKANYVGTFVWRKKDGGGQAKEDFVIEHEYIVVYRKSEEAKWIDLTEERDISEYNKEDEKGKYKATKLAKWGNTARREDRPSMFFPIIAPDGTNCFPIAPDGGEGRWRVGKPKMDVLIREGLVHWEKKDGTWIPYEKEYFANQEKTIKDRSILYKLASTGDGSNVLTEIFGKKDAFENPKPIELLGLFIRGTSETEDIIMDFFSGSATTAHAVMKLNAENDIHRKFVLVQIPEECVQGSVASSLGFETICDIGEERIRRVGKSLKEEYNTEMDYGFRVFRIDSSNMKDIYYRSADTEQNLLDTFADNIKHDRTPEDLLFQVMLDLGVLLSSKIEEKEIAGKKVFSVADGFLVACFDKDVTDETIRAVAKMKPYYAVFRDSSIASDSVATNFDQIFASISPDTIRKVL